MSGYPEILMRRSRLAFPRSAAVMDHVDEYNIECYLAWRSKWDRRYVGQDAWRPIARFWFTQYYTEARAKADAFLNRNGLISVTPFRKPARIRFQRESS